MSGDVRFHIEIGDQWVGPGHFDDEQDAHQWVARERPGERYRIVRLAGRAGAARVEHFEPANPPD